jgi:glycosyltransferase involved in cell wall biosynthesis
MKILYVINKMEKLAGIERILSCKMNYLSEESTHQIYLVTYEQFNQALSFQLNDKIIYRPINAPIPQREGLTVLKWLKAYFSSRKTFRREFYNILGNIHPEIVICTGYAHPVLDIIIDTSRKINTKIIVESHVKGDTVSMNKYFFNHTLAYLFSFWDSYIYKKIKKADCVVTLTNEDKEFWKPYSQRVEVIPNVLTITPHKVTDYRVKRVIAAGRYVHQKGFDLLLEAWHLIDESYNDWQLYIFGNESRTPFQRIVDKYEMNSNVHLMPATKDIVEEFSKSSIFVLSSRFEGFGLVLAEAMSCGLPCVSFDCPYGPRDIITDGEDGILVENSNVKALSKAIERLIADENLRQSMGEKAIINVARYNSSNIMNRWEKLFSSL